MNDERDRAYRRQEGALAWLFDDHDALEEDLQWLDRYAADEEVRALRQGDLKAWVDRLRSKLLEHFATEESSDLFTTLPERAPRYATAVYSLKAEHGVIISALRGISIELERNASSATLRRLDDLVLKLRAHEATENRILLEANTMDLGLAPKR